MAAQPKVMAPRILARMFIVVFLFPLVPMIISGDWAWWEAWVCALINSIGFVVTLAMLARCGHMYSSHFYWIQHGRLSQSF